MSLKRPAEHPADGESQSKKVASNPFLGLSLSGAAAAAGPGGGFGTASASAPGTSNPFAGISLSAPSAPSGSLFTAAAAATRSVGGAGFANTPSPATAKPTGFGSVSPVATATSNPFVGLSLSGGSVTSSGGLFASAVSSLAASTGTDATEKVVAEEKVAKESDSPAPVPSAAADTTSCSDRVKDSVAAEDVSDSKEGDAPADSTQATGEEEEEVIFHAECKLSKLVRNVVLPPPDASASSTSAASGVDDAGSPTPSSNAGVAVAGQENGWRWQQKGCGILHINRHAKTGAGRLVMRMRGVLKVLLNTPVFPTSKYERVGQKSVSFLGIDPEDSTSKDGQISLCAYRLTLQNSDQPAKFLSVLQSMSNRK